MDHVAVLAGIGGVFLLACLSPGPVWVVITSTSVAVSRRAGILVGLGVAGATLTWATLAMLGLGVLAQLAWLTTAIKLGGAACLAWIGLRMIAGAGRPVPASETRPAPIHGGWRALRRGYLASITNPKAAAFFGSIFVVMLPAHAPAWVDAATVGLLSALSAAWHCGLAVLFSAPPVQAGYRKAKAGIDRAVGTMLLLSAARLATSR